MKYLIFYDHQGQKVMEHPVYVEGQDFRWEAVNPIPVWLGTILLVDKELEEGEEVIVEEVEKEPSYDLSPEEIEEMLEPKPKEVTVSEWTEGKEEKHEPEKVRRSSRGHRRSNSSGKP